jgi:hypothetical protein
MKSLNTLAALLAAATVLSAPAATPAPAPAPTPASTYLKGEVLETRNVESYTYLRLKTAQGEVWAAVPTTAAKKGSQVTIGNTMVMQNFESKTLNKTFDKIVFGQIVEPGAQPAAAHGTVPAAKAEAPVVKVAKASGPDAKTVAEVVTGRAALKDKTVLVRGQVVKVNLGIMGKNWLHLQDGSGAAAAGSNDILVTTKSEAAIGDIVNAKGTVRTDVNVGPGYAYDVLIEDAALSK